MSGSSGPPTRRSVPGGAGEDSSAVAFAVCLDCGTDIDAWRERLLPVRSGRLAVTERGELAIDVEREGACTACGGGSAEIRVEARPRMHS